MTDFRLISIPKDFSPNRIYFTRQGVTQNEVFKFIWLTFAGYRIRDSLLTSAAAVAAASPRCLYFTFIFPFLSRTFSFQNRGINSQIYPHRGLGSAHFWVFFVFFLFFFGLSSVFFCGNAATLSLPLPAMGQIL